MGQAKQRGTFEQRVQQSLTRHERHEQMIKAIDDDMARHPSLHPDASAQLSHSASSALLLSSLFSLGAYSSPSGR